MLTRFDVSRFRSRQVAAWFARFIMLNVFFRRAALLARAPSLGLACALMMGMPVAQAVEADPPERAAVTLLKQYQGWRDEPLQDWRQANERVGEIGGWRTYLREAQQGSDSAAPGRHDHHGQ
jgi:hypothetical protein